MAAQLHALVEAGWLAATVSLGLGARALVAVLHPLTVPFAVLIAAALVIWVAGGMRDRLGRAFDLACVAVVPLVAVELVIVVVAQLGSIAVPELVAAIAAYGWTGAWIAIAIVELRRRGPRAVPARCARLAGGAFVVLAVLGIAADATWIARHLDEVRPMSSGEAAPAFALPAIGPGGALGPRITLASTHGKITVIDFWATWCNPCLKSLPRLDAFARRHPEIAVLAIDLDQPADARALFDERHYSMTLLLDDGATSARYGVATVPHTVVIDRDGRVRAVGRGGELDLEQVIAHL